MYLVHRLLNKVCEPIILDYFFFEGNPLFFLLIFEVGLLEFVSMFAFEAQDGNDFNNNNHYSLINQQTIIVYSDYSVYTDICHTCHRHNIIYIIISNFIIYICECIQKQFIKIAMREAASCVIARAVTTVYALPEIGVGDLVIVVTDRIVEQHRLCNKLFYIEKHVLVFLNVWLPG